MKEYKIISYYINKINVKISKMFTFVLWQVQALHQLLTGFLQVDN